MTFFLSGQRVSSQNPRSQKKIDGAHYMYVEQNPR